MTPQNFLAVLKGDAAGVKGGSGKVLKRQVTIKTVAEWGLGVISVFFFFLFCVSLIHLH